MTTNDDSWDALKDIVDDTTETRYVFTKEELDKYMLEAFMELIGSDEVDHRKSPRLHHKNHYTAYEKEANNYMPQAYARNKLKQELRDLATKKFGEKK